MWGYVGSHRRRAVLAKGIQPNKGGRDGGMVGGLKAGKERGIMETSTLDNDKLEGTKSQG
jgi:hypothetical protein